MAADHADVAIESFVELEARFADCLRFVPPDPSHLRVYSPVLASIFLDTCSLLESILKSAMDNARYDGIRNIAQHRARRYATTPPYLNINDLRAVFRPDGYYAKRVWFLTRGEPSFPWYVWRNSGGHPTWWGAYNHVKHDRFGNAREATLNTVMHALQGTFLAMIQSLEFRRRLVERGIIRSQNMTTAALQAVVAAWEPLPTPEIVLASTRLFGYKFMSTGSPAQASDASVFL